MPQHHHRRGDGPSGEVGPTTEEATEEARTRTKVEVTAVEGRRGPGTLLVVADPTPNGSARMPGSMTATQEPTAAVARATADWAVEVARATAD